MTNAAGAATSDAAQRIVTRRDSAGDADTPLPPDTDLDGLCDALEAGSDALNPATSSGLVLANGNTASITTLSAETLTKVASGIATDAPGGIDSARATSSYAVTSSIGGSVTARINVSNRLPDNLVAYKVDQAGAYTEPPKPIGTHVTESAVDITSTDGDLLSDRKKWSMV